MQVAVVNTCTTMFNRVSRFGSRRLELLVLYARPGARCHDSAPPLLLAVAVTTVIVITLLEWLPLCLTKACILSTRLCYTLAERKKTQYVSAVLIRVYYVYSPIHNQRFAYCRYHCASEVTHVTSTPLVGIYGLSTAPANKPRTAVTLEAHNLILRYTVHTGSGAHSLRSRNTKERGDDPLSLDSSPTQWQLKNQR